MLQKSNNSTPFHECRAFNVICGSTANVSRGISGLSLIDLFGFLTSALECLWWSKQEALDNRKELIVITSD